MEIATEAIQGKYGKYAYSHDKYLWMKKAHALFIRAIIDRKRWHRWAKKQPRNRGAEPKCFMTDNWYDSFYKRCSNNGGHFHMLLRIDDYYYHNVLNAYRITRYPMHIWDSKKVIYNKYCEDILTSPKFVKLIEDLEKFYNSDET